MWLDCELVLFDLDDTPRPGKSCVMVGDSWESDIEGATGAGLRTVFPDRHDIRPDCQVARLRSLADLHFAPAPA